MERKKAKSHRHHINLHFRFLFSSYIFLYRSELKPYGILFGPLETGTNQCLEKDIPQIRQRLDNLKLILSSKNLKLSQLVQDCRNQISNALSKAYYLISSGKFPILDNWTNTGSHYILL